ncbi:post-PEP-CTERM-1 domain-containing protein [Massilia jejuensis]|uniref:Post-PEP-CTERM-1 domain-containing protein n=1 Tax=Massilia jejuensis TaxID=648894 RepID=A0ABW0PM03_9BURK
MHLSKYIFLRDKHMPSPVFKLPGVLAIAAFALSGSVFAAGQEFQTVHKDKVTGRIRNATAAEAKQLHDLHAADLAARKAARQAEGAPATGVVRLQQNGIAAAHVDEESIMYSVMRRNADGKLEFDCVHGSHAAETALNSPVSTHSKEQQHEVQ